MSTSVPRQSSTATPVELGGDLRIEVLAPGRPLPDAVNDLIAAGLAEGQKFLERASANWSRPGGPYEDPRSMMVVVFQEGVAVAMAGVAPDEYARDPDVGRLKHVYVRASHRRRGLADAMVRFCLARCEAGFRRLRLRAATPEAGRLYERHGFVHDPGRADYTHVRERPARGSDGAAGP